MAKIWTIAYRQLYTTFRDRNLLLIMVGVPLVVSLMVGLAFGGADGGFNISHIPIAVLNLDEGIEQQGTALNYGQNLTDLLVTGTVSTESGEDTMAACSLVAAAADGEAAPMSLDELLDGREVDDVDMARAEVDNGDLTALIVIPAGYSERLAVDPNRVVEGQQSEPLAPVEIEIYANGGQTIYASIVRSIVDGYTNQMLTGNFALSASIGTLIEDKPIAALALQANVNSDRVNGVFACAYSDDLNLIGIDSQPVTRDENDVVLSTTVIIMVSIGSAQAAFMAMFTGMFGALSIYEERRLGTLQRLIVSPTPYPSILAGKLLGTFVTVLFQLVAVFVALTLIASAIQGELLLIWGRDYLAIIGVLLGMAIAAAGVGILIGAVAKSAEQAGAFGPVIMIVLSLIGGAFGVAFPPEVAQFSPVYHGSTAFAKLSEGNSDIIVHLLWLIVIGGILFVSGVVLFRRRLAQD